MGVTENYINGTFYSESFNAQQALTMVHCCSIGLYLIQLMHKTLPLRIV